MVISRLFEQHQIDLLKVEIYVPILTQSNLRSECSEATRLCRNNLLIRLSRLTIHELVLPVIKDGG